MKSCWGSLRRSQRSLVSRGRGFTMVEMLVVMTLVGMLAALLVGTFGPARATARRAVCDSRVKALSIALDAFRQERERYPRSLSNLVSDRYINDSQMMRCPDDGDESSAGYDAFYILRGGRNDPRWPQLPLVGGLPTIVCPLHESSGVGVQAFGGLQTHQFATRAAVLVGASAASVKRPGKKSAVPAQPGMPLHGGDIIETGAGGAALIQFFDGSRCELSGGTKITVLQSFLRNSSGGLYTLVRQTLGDVTYSVTHGSKFDVSTPTATAGALGTKFIISIRGEPTSSLYAEWWINISNTMSRPTLVAGKPSDVFCSTPRRTIIIERNKWVNVGRESLRQTPLNGATGSSNMVGGGSPSGPSPGN